MEGTAEDREHLLYQSLGHKISQHCQDLQNVFSGACLCTRCRVEVILSLNAGMPHSFHEGSSLAENPIL